MESTKKIVWRHACIKKSGEQYRVAFCPFWRPILWTPPLPPVYTPVEKVLRKKGQKQVKKKAFKINTKIEDVGLNED